MRLRVASFPLLTFTTRSRSPRRLPPLERRDASLATVDERHLVCLDVVSNGATGQKSRMREF
jgi:hypothetical protein